MGFIPQTHETMTRIYSFLFVFIVSILSSHGALTFKTGQKYRFQCTMQATQDLYIFPGAVTGINSPLCHGKITENNAEASYWYITKIGAETYTLKNAATQQYITYDGEYTNTPTQKRYIALTDEPDGANSQWTITLSGDNDIILINVGHPSHRFNTRKNTGYIVGTYEPPGSPSENEVFAFYDEQGNRVVDQDGSGGNETLFGTTKDGYYWENTGLTEPVVYTTNTQNPILYTIKNARSGKYLSIVDGTLVQTEDKQSQFYVVNGTDGALLYAAAGDAYLSGAVPSEDINQPVNMLKGSTAKSDNTWKIGYHPDENHSGYTLSVGTCSQNEGPYAEHPYYWDGYLYLNDYQQKHICFYLADDPGNQFIFYSKDTRHKNYLEQKGFSLPQPGEKPIVAVNKLLDELKINGKPAIYDALYNVYMMPLRNADRGGKNYQAEITTTFVGNGKYTISIEQTPISAETNSYQFDKVTGNKLYALEVLDQEGDCVAKASITFTFMPIVEVNGKSFSSGYFQPGSIRVNDPDHSGVDSLYHANFRYRGATASGMSKKSYAIKLKDANGNSIDRRFLSLRDDNNWILDAMAVDPGRVRNRVSTDLWNDFSTPPYQKAEEPKAINGTRGRFVEVILNGSYAGLYCFTEKIDRKQLKLKKIKPGKTTAIADTIRGVLYKSKGWSYSVFMGHNVGQNYYPGTSPAAYNNQREAWDSWEVKYPDLGDGEDIDWTPLYNAINFVATATNATTFKANVEKYFDLPVWRDYNLFLDLLLATDNHGKNMYIYNYDKQKSTKTSLTPWDLDGTWGRRWNGSNNITSNAAQDFATYIKANEHGEHTLLYKLGAYNYNNWKEQLEKRYAELRTTFFDEKALKERFINYRTLFYESGAEAREYNRWNNSNGIALNFSYEVEYITQWIEDRLNALDKKYKYDPTIIGTAKDNNYLSITGGKNQISIYTNKAETITVYNMEGLLILSKKIPEGYVTIDNLKPGIYLVNRQKVLVQ